MKRLLLIIILATLTACGKQPIVLPTETPIPTVVSPTPVPTSTLEPPPDIVLPPITPTRPGETLITPDGIQVERWKEYQTALAKNVLAHLPPEEVLCEWEILGRSGNDVYLWAVCSGKDGGGSLPAVIHLETDGAIQSVERSTNWSRDIPRLFPPYVIEKFAYYQGGRAREMREHIEWRQTHPEEPPLIILSSASTLVPVTITPSPFPTQPIIAITPYPAQLERWAEYEEALAMVLLPPNFFPGEVLCEWDLLGQSDQEIYVWAFCQSPPLTVRLPPSIHSIPAVIHFGDDGAVQSVEIPGSGTAYARDIQEMFPSDVQEIIFRHSIDTEKMEAHINSRRENPNPPSIVLSATLTP